MQLPWQNGNNCRLVRVNPHHNPTSEPACTVMPVTPAHHARHASSLTFIAGGNKTTRIHHQNNIPVFTVDPPAVNMIHQQPHTPETKKNINIIYSDAHPSPLASRSEILTLGNWGEKVKSQRLTSRQAERKEYQIPNTFQHPLLR